MGQIIKAKCSNCGFENKFFFGAGKATFKVKSMIPAINKSTGEFVVENYFTEKDNPYLTFYNSPELHNGEDNDYLSWRSVKLFKKGNKCPNCQEFTLEFETIGYFD